MTVYDKFQDDLPSHKCGLYIEHNAHIDSHRAVKDRIEDLDLDVEDFVNHYDVYKTIISKDK